MRCIALIGLVVVTACGDDVPNFPDLQRDSAVECTEGAPPPSDGGRADAAAPLVCPAGDVCVGGRCYPSCDDDAQCADSQVCQAGLCVDGDRPDSGPGEDAGTDAFVDPCADVMCEAAEVCHPTGSCVECTGRPECGPAAPICDFAYGTCKAFVASQVCAPCNESLDCDGGRTCATLSSLGERVCLASCEGGAACPQGFVCDTMTEVCAPRLGSCTSIRNALAGQSCMMDSDCVPLGQTAPSDICRGEDVGGGIPGACVQLCGTPEQCTTGFTCTGGVCVAM